MRCPVCASTDVADLVTKNDDEKNRICLDCDFKWKAGGRR